MRRGWDSIWFTEHHLNHEGMDACPNPLMMSANIAARTKSIRIGQAAAIIMFWNPLPVAENITMLDDGRNGLNAIMWFGPCVSFRLVVHISLRAAAVLSPDTVGPPIMKAPICRAISKSRS